MGGPEHYHKTPPVLHLKGKFSIFSTMKFIPVVSVLAATASADLLSLVKTLEAQANNSTQNGPQFRNFDNIWDGLGGIFASMTQQITTSGDYGCWCYFASNNGYVGSGSGNQLTTTIELVKLYTITTLVCKSTIPLAIHTPS